MANVEPYVQQIRQAVYGEQVRESIARSIEEMNQDNIDTQAHYDATVTAAETATTNANNAATGATNITNLVQQKLDDGDFDGPQGPTGDAATISVGSVQTGQPGTGAQVVNVGTDSQAILNFVIPQGATGQVENLDSVPISWNLDSTYQNIVSGMTIMQLFARLQLLVDLLLLTDTECTTLEQKLGLPSTGAGSRLFRILDEATNRGRKSEKGRIAAQLVPAGSYIDRNITFENGFTYAPTVFAQLVSTSTSPDLGSFAVVLTNTTPTDCTLRIFNNSSNSRAPAVQWFALGRLGE